MTILNTLPEGTKDYRQVVRDSSFFFWLHRTKPKAAEGVYLTPNSR